MLTKRHARTRTLRALRLFQLLDGLESRLLLTGWIGGSGTWGTPANWFGGTKPGGLNDASFLSEGTVNAASVITLNGPEACNNLSISGSFVIFDLGGNVLTVNNKIEIHGSGVEFRNGVVNCTNDVEIGDPNAGQAEHPLLAVNGGTLTTVGSVLVAQNSNTYGELVITNAGNVGASRAEMGYTGTFVLRVTAGGSLNLTHDLDCGHGLIFGNGTISAGDGVRIAANTLLCPGGSGTHVFDSLSIVGDFDASAGFFFSASFNPGENPSSNRIVVDGTATLGGNVYISGENLGGDFNTWDSFEILTADSVDGTFFDNYPIPNVSMFGQGDLPDPPDGYGWWLDAGSDLTLHFFTYGGGGRATMESGGESAPAAPTLLQSINVGSLGLLVNWQDNSDNETGFEVQRKTDDGEWTTVRVAHEDSPAFLDTAVVTGHDYTYRVRALGGSEELNSDWTTMGYSVSY